MDEDILIMLLNKDPDGLSILKTRYGSLISYVVSGILKDPRDIDECLNDIYIKIWNGAEGFSSSKGKLSVWLTAIARNSAIDISRRVKPSEEELSEKDAHTPSTEEELLRKELKQSLASALFSLSTQDRLLVYRKYYYLQSTAQIAAELGVTEKTVEGRLYRVRKKLKHLLGGDFDGK